MKQSAVVLARCIAYVETIDLSPFGHVFFPDLAKELVRRYQFQKFPTEFGDYDETKGVEFLEGKHGDEVISKLVVYNTGILLDARSNTRVSKEIIQGALSWATDRFGLTYAPEMIRRFAYVSHVTFYSDISLDNLNPILSKLSRRISSALSEIHGEQIDYQTTGVAIQHDQLKRKYPLAAFTIAPRIETPLSEHKYFSEAPLPTDLHWELLQEFEEALKK